jgi:Ulp1 family protease
VTCLRRYHWILLVIMLDHSKIYVMDSMRKPKSEYNDLLQLLDRYTL